MTELRLPPINDYERKVLLNVEKHGWQCTSVFDPNDAKPPFSYSIGLYQTYRQPEFIIFGLDSKVAHSILAICARRFEAGGSFELDQPSEDLINDFPCLFVQVPREKHYDYVFSALWFYAETEFPLYQIIWPDPNGFFPWHPEASEGFRQNQPVLGQAGGT